MPITDPCTTTQQEAINYKFNTVEWSLIYTLYWTTEWIQATLREAESTRASGKNPSAVNEAIIYIVDVLRGKAGEDLPLFNSFSGLPDPVIPVGVNLRINFDTPELATLIQPPVQRIPRGPLQMVPYSL